MPMTLTEKPFAADAAELLNALPHAILTVGPDGAVLDANSAAEAFFEMSRASLKRNQFRELLPFGSPLLGLIEYVRQRGAAVNEYRVDIGTPRIGTERVVDVHAAPMPGSAEIVIIMLQERTIADKMDRQLTHRGAARWSLPWLLCWPMKSRIRSLEFVARRNCWNQPFQMKIGL